MHIKQHLCSLGIIIHSSKDNYDKKAYQYQQNVTHIYISSQFFACFPICFDKIWSKL